MSQYKMVALDMDGTLLNNKHEISERSAQALKKLSEKGVMIVIATGRSSGSVTKYVTTALAQLQQQKVPMIGYCNPELLQLTNELCEIKIALSNETKNHVQSMYFGALAVGADITSGFLAISMCDRQSEYVELVFKDFKIDFKRRAMADAHFICRDGEVIERMIEETLATGQRISEEIKVNVTTPSISDETIAECNLTLSLKRKGQADHCNE